MALELEHVRKQIGEVAEARAGLMHKIDAIEVKLSAEKGEQGKLLLLGMELALHQQLAELMKMENALSQKEEVLLKKELQLQEEKLILLRSGAAAGLGAGAGGAAAGLGAGAGVLEELKKTMEDFAQKTQDELSNMHASQEETNQTLRGVKSLFSILFLKEFRPTSASTASSANDYRQGAFDYYGVTGTKIKCMITGMEVDAKDIKAAHIYRRKGWPRSMLDVMMKKVDDPTNILLLRREVEARFDKFEVCVVPLDESDFQVKVLFPGLLTDNRMKYIGMGKAGDKMMWKDVNGKGLHLDNDKQPARRLLAFHASLAVWHAVEMQWIREGEVVIPRAGWESPGFNRDLMTRFLADVHQLNDINDLAEGTDGTDEHLEEGATEGLADVQQAS